MTGPDLALLAAHLEEETAVLLAALDAAGPEAWARPTPARGWSVADQVAHLAYFDVAATASVAGEAAFAPYRAEAAAVGPALCDDVAERLRGRAPAELRAWLLEARAEMIGSMRAAGPSARVPWYGPAFSVASAMTGRIMETWAHGQDVVDALGVPHRVTGALYDVARLCARTRANSYAAHGRAAPEVEVAVVLDAPDHSTWRFGGPAEASITGSAVEFCLVATQRRHRDDTGLIASGDAAREWLSIAQAFAGPPGEGRRPGSS